MAILALPAVAGKFGVRGGGYSMSNSSAWNISKPWLGPEPATRIVNMNKLGRALMEPSDPPIKAMFVYNANPVATLPDQQRVLQGMARDDLFTVVFDQVMTDTAAYADVILPATTFLEAYDFAKGYGPLSLQLVRPVIDTVGESRSNPEVFGELAKRLGVLESGETDNELDMLLEVFKALPGDAGTQIGDTGRAVPPFGLRPVQFVDVMPRTFDGKVDLFPEALEAEAPTGLYTYQDDPSSERFPLALISPASDKTISSTLGELPRPGVAVVMNPADAASRGLKQDDPIRMFNELGEVQCAVKIDDSIREGTVSLPKGLWRKSTWNQSTANTLVPDSLTDLGGGACFNDARVQVARLEHSPSQRTDAQSAENFLVIFQSANLPVCECWLWEDPEFLVDDRNLVDREDERRRPQVSHFRLAPQRVADFLVGDDHRVFQPRIDDGELVGDLDERFALGGAEFPAGGGLDGLQQTHARSPPGGGDRAGRAAHVTDFSATRSTKR